MFKNVASQKIAVYAHDTATDTPKTGDQGNITMQISKDGAACAPSNDASPAQLDAVNAPGIYIFDLTQAETNANMVVFHAQSSTGGIQLEPVIVFTDSVKATADSIEAKVDIVDTVVDGIAGKTVNLPASPAAVGSAMTLATDAVSADAVKTDAVTEIVTAIFAKTGLTAGGAASFGTIIKTIYAFARGKVTLDVSGLPTIVARFYDDDNTTLLFTLTATLTGRTVA